VTARASAAMARRRVRRVRRAAVNRDLIHMRPERGRFPFLPHFNTRVPEGTIYTPTKALLSHQGDTDGDTVLVLKVKGAKQ
jgi:hypothetical protein